jgi:flagellar protein FlaG
MNRHVEDATRNRQVEELNALLEKRQSYLRFEEDKGSERMVIFIKNGETGEVIRQIPSPEFLAMSENLKRFLEMDGSSARMAVPPGLLTYETA